ncbi:leucyl aminopeptidase [Stappia taiwanensis]|uniref:leucyl aminopeptidase family protein n=1 Tax=Stappia taiwanensis TaxID=992267 RepID=UPI00199ED0ED|nr:leucyl aminopeptidase [Stappia taiwanensis]
MRQFLLPFDAARPTTPIHLVDKATLPDLLQERLPEARDWAAACGFDGGAGELLLVPGADGGLAAVVFGLAASAPSRFAVGALATRLPAGDYRIEGDNADGEDAALAFAMSAYRFKRYRNAGEASEEKPAARLMLAEGVDLERIGRTLDAVGLARDLINTPANDLGPEELAAAATDLFARHGGTTSVTLGDDLLAAGFPMVHAVGRASSRAPRLIDCRWGEEDHPKVSLIGKGVVFDTGGLDIKPASAMGLMKKDMGGAANVLALASMIMAARLPVRLRVVVPAVENAISGAAFRPGDVLPSRKGLSVEIGNTDAEGRLVLADALTLADEEKPDLMIDMATLTGAARVALGPELPPFYTADEAFAARLATASEAVADPLWRLPLWAPYMSYLDSSIADINHINTRGAGFAGSVTAALFLSRFVENAGTWTHLDVYGWNPFERPGHPAGGEAQGIRALFSVLEERYPAG